MGLLVYAPGLTIILAGLALAFKHPRAGYEPGGRIALGAASVAAVPVALAGFFFLAEEAVHGVGPIGEAPASVLFAALALLVPGLMWCATRIPWQKAWLPAGLAPVATILAGIGPSDGTLNWNVVTMATALLAAAVLLPRAIATGLERPGARQHAGAGALGVLLLLGAALGATFTWSGLVMGGAPVAHHEWTATVEPEGDAPYRVVMPFLEAGEPSSRDMLDALAERVHVGSGDARIEWVANGTALAVNATGPVQLGATYRFLGNSGQRETFVHYLTPAEPSLLSAGGPEIVRLTWGYRFDGGGAMSCFAQDEGVIRLAPEEPTPLRGTTGTHDQDGRLGSICG